MLFDTHTHYCDERFDADRDEIISKAHENGVAYILNASSNMASAVESISLAQRYSFVYAAVGVHPHESKDVNESTIVAIGDFLKNEKVVAIGEIGLDYYYDFSPKEIQRHWFARQIQMARQFDLPIIVHDRDAHEDALKIIKNEGAREVGGVLHCYSGSVEMARELLNNNFYLSFGGSVTFKNSKRAAEVIKFAPEDRLLIETDCPYLTPEPYRGKRNDSGYVRLVAEKIAEIRDTTFEKVAEFTMDNAKRLFKIE